MPESGGFYFFIWSVYFHPKGFLPSLFPLENPTSLVSVWQTKPDLTALAHAALINQLSESIIQKQTTLL